jgi:hypothetical protein
MRAVRPITRGVVVKRARPLGGDILVECAAERDIQQLNAATDAQERQAVGGGTPRQRQLDLVA